MIDPKEEELEVVELDGIPALFIEERVLLRKKSNSSLEKYQWNSTIFENKYYKYSMMMLVKNRLTNRLFG